MGKTSYNAIRNSTEYLLLFGRDNTILMWRGECFFLRRRVPSRFSCEYDDDDSGYSTDSDRPHRCCHQANNVGSCRILLALLSGLGHAPRLPLPPVGSGPHLIHSLGLPELLAQVDTFPYLGSLNTEDGECKTEFCTRLNRGQAIEASLQKIWKSHNIPISTKIRLMKALVWPVATYGC